MAYLAPGGQDFTDSVFITEYEGEANAVEVASSREGYESRYRRTRYGPIEPLSIAGRPGWAWTEAQDGDAALTLVGVVPLGGRTYGIELRIGRKEGRDLAAMKRMVASFHVPRRRDPLPWGFVVFGAALLALTSFLARQNVAERQRPGRASQG